MLGLVIDIPGLRGGGEVVIFFEPPKVQNFFITGKSGKLFTPVYNIIGYKGWHGLGLRFNYLQGYRDKVMQR